MPEKLELQYLEQIHKLVISTNLPIRLAFIITMVSNNLAFSTFVEKRI